MKAKKLQVGTARRQITPLVPVSLCGYFYLRMWERVRDDLHVSVVALSDGETKLAIVQFDWAVMPFPIVERLREAVSELSCCDSLKLICTCTHTHNSPEVRLTEPGYNEEYTHWAVEQAAAAICSALSKLQTCDRVLVGQATVGDVAFNRRYWMTSGNVVTNPPRASHAIVRPEGTIDPEIPLVAFERDGELAVILASIVNHTDTLGTSDISSDWPGVVRKELESIGASGLLVMPLIGASGNVNHIDAMRPGEIYHEENPTRIGMAYVRGIQSALKSLRPIAWNDLATVCGRFSVSPREIDQAELANAKRDAQEFANHEFEKLTAEGLARNTPAARKYFADALLRVAADRRDKQYEVNIVQIGEVVVVTMPGEPFVEIGLAIRKGLLAGRHAMIIAHGNAAPNYFPLPENYANGGYETTPLCSPHGTDSAVRMLGAVCEALRDLGMIAQQGNRAQLSNVRVPTTV